MIVIVGAFVGLFFSTAGMVFLRMGAFHLFALPGSPEHLTGLRLVLPLVGDLQQPGTTMVAGGWLVATFVGAYLAGTVARTVAAATLVQLVMTAAALVLATQGVEPWWLAGTSVLLAWWGGRMGENALCTASRAARQRHRDLPAPAPVVEPTHPTAAAQPDGPLWQGAGSTASVAPLPGFGGNGPAVLAANDEWFAPYRGRTG